MCMAMTQYRLTEDLQAIDGVTLTQEWTGHTVTLPAGMLFYIVSGPHPGRDFPQYEYYLILCAGTLYLPMRNQLEGKYEISK